MLRRDYPLMIDSVVIPFPNKYDEASDTIEDVNETEAGTTIRTVSRYDKKTISLSFTVTSEWAIYFKQLYVGQASRENPIGFMRYSLYTEGYETLAVVMRNFKASPRYKSGTLEATEGVWDINFTFEEVP